MKKLLFLSAIFISFFAQAQKIPSGGYSGQVLKKTTGQNLGWVSKQDSLTIQAPLEMSGSTLSLPRATDSTNGYLDTTDFQAFTGTSSNGPLFFANAATTTSLSATYSASTLTLSSPLTVLDSYTITVGDSLLFKDQVAQLQNGLYVYESSTVLTRCTSYDETAEIYPSQVNVLFGTVNGAKYFLQTSVDPVVGTNVITYTTIATPTIVGTIYSANGAIAGAAGSTRVVAMANKNLTFIGTGATFRVNQTDIQLNAGTGASSQIKLNTNKLGFYSTTPITKPAAVTTPQGIATALTSLGLLSTSTITATDLFTQASGYVHLTSTTDKFGVGSSADPGASLGVKGQGATSGTFTAKFSNSSAVLSLQIRDDGSVYNIGKGTSSTNTAFGDGVMLNNTTVNNTGYGSGCMPITSSGYNITGNGFNCLNLHTTAINISAYGAYSASTIAGGSGECGAFGLYALGSAATPTRCYAFGNYAANGCTGTSYDIVAIGQSPLSAAGVKHSDIAIGTNSLGLSTTASKQVAVGVGTGGSITTQDGGIFLGYYAGNLETAANKLYVGNVAYASEALGRTGSIIYGVMDATNTNQRLFFNSSVMAGVASPATTATDGLLYIPSCAGVPTGVPTAQTGYCPVIIDQTNNKMYIYSGGAWVILN